MEVITHKQCVKLVLKMKKYRIPILNIEIAQHIVRGCCKKGNVKLFDRYHLHIMLSQCKFDKYPRTDFQNIK